MTPEEWAGIVARDAEIGRSKAGATMTQSARDRRALIALVEEMRSALDDLLDDYLARNGPDGYPHPMPRSWRTVRDFLKATKP